MVVVVGRGLPEELWEKDTEGRTHGETVRNSKLSDCFNQFFHPKVSWNVNSLSGNLLWSPGHDSTFKKDVVQLLSCMYPALCNPGFPVLHNLPKFAQTHVHWVFDAIQPSYPLLPPSPPAFILSQHQSFPISQLFPSGDQSIRALASASVLSMNIQGWFPLGLTDLISL